MCNRGNSRSPSRYFPRDIGLPVNGNWVIMLAALLIRFHTQWSIGVHGKGVQSVRNTAVNCPRVEI
jgi:hypothetical protein